VEHSVSLKKKKVVFSDEAPKTEPSCIIMKESCEIENTAHSHTFYFRGLLKKMDVHNDPDQVQLDEINVKDYVGEDCQAHDNAQ
jgi:hypothetical protein